MIEAIETATAYNQVFNIGANEPYSVNELAVTVAHAIGVEPEIIYLIARSEAKHAYSSHDKVQKIFGKRKRHELKEGLDREAERVKQHGARKSKSFDEVEVMKNFRQAWLSGHGSGSSNNSGSTHCNEQRQD